MAPGCPAAPGLLGGLAPPLIRGRVSAVGGISLSVVGIGVVGSTVDLSTIYVSGTSFAKPVAAGIAAKVLEYGRYHIDDLNKR